MEIESITSAKINISVEYYNEDHRRLLNDKTRYATDFIENMKKLISNGVEITGGEFLINSLFYKKDTNPNKYTQRDSLISAIESATHYFIDDLEVSSNSIRVQEDSNPEAAIVMKRVGESIGLSVISRIIGANEADWTVIPEIGIKAFDFKYAVTTKGVVQVETKGSSSNDVSKKNNNIYSHKGHIEEKKDEMATNTKHPHRGDYNYGTIAFCPVGGVGNIKCYLLDPPSGSTDINLEEVRLSKRLGFYYNIMSFISPESKLINLLHERIIDLYEGNIRINTAKPLPYPNGVGDYKKSHVSFFLHKKTIKLGNSRISGDWFHLKKDHIVFIGMKNSALDDIVLQNTTSLLNDESEVLSGQKEITFNIITNYQKNQFKKLKSENDRIDESNNFKAKGKITILKSGIAIGILRLISQ